MYKGAAFKFVKKVEMDDSVLGVSTSGAFSC